MGGWRNQELDIRRAFKRDILENDNMEYSKDAAKWTTTLESLEWQVELVIDLNLLIIKNKAGFIGNNNNQSNNMKKSVELAIVTYRK